MQRVKSKLHSALSSYISYIHNCAALYYRRFHLQCIAPQEVKTKLHHFELHKVITAVCNVLQEVKTELHFMYWNRSKLHCDVHCTAFLARCQNCSSILSERSKQFFSPTIRQAHEKQYCSAGGHYCTADELQGNQGLIHLRWTEIISHWNIQQGCNNAMQAFSARHRMHCIAVLQ